METEDRYEKPNGGQALARQQGGTIARQGLGGEELEITGETAGTVLAAQARAMVEARFVMALRRPRDWDDVRLKLLRACERPGFAEGILDPGEQDPKKARGAAWYRKPIGKDGVEGFSIRFAEEAIRTMGNVDVQTVTVYDDQHKRIVTVVVTDLESNVSFPRSILVEKTVERKHPRQGQEIIRARTNSYGDAVFIVEATEDEVNTKQESLISKAIRNGALRLLPGDIQAECRQRILEIRMGDAAKDPNKARRDLGDGFGKINVLPSALKLYLGHDLGEATPAEIADLRGLYKAISNGEVTWHDALNQVLEDRDEARTDEQPAGAASKPADKLKDDLRAKRQAKEQPPATGEGKKSATSREEPASGATVAQDGPEEPGEGQPTLAGTETGAPAGKRSRLVELFDTLIERAPDKKAQRVIKESLELATGQVSPLKVDEAKIQAGIEALMKLL